MRWLLLVGFAVAGGLYLGADRKPRDSVAQTSAYSHGDQMSAALRSAFVRARQSEAGSAYDFAPRGALGAAVLQSNNPAMGLVTQALLGGMRLQPAGAGSEQGRVALSLVRQGCTDGPQAVGAVAPEAKGNRVEYARDGVTEWYVNGPLGLEQGFTVTRELGCARALMFEMQLDKSVSAELQSAGTVVAMNAGGHIYRYGELYAYDADGKELASAMELEGQRLRLIVQARGARYPVEVDPRMYVEEAQLTGADTTINDLFGVAVSYSADTAVIGASNKSSGRGQAYVFVRSGLQWSQQAKLTPSDGAAGDNFGTSVAVSGNTAVVGSPQKNNQLGQAYVYVRSGKSWSLQTKLTASDGAPGDFYGNAVAISGDTVVVGLTAPTRNKAYVYLRSGTMWSEQATLVPSDGTSGDLFGLAVAAHLDTVLVGAAKKAVGGQAAQGQAYVYVREGTTWSEQAKLTAADGAANDEYGYGVALHEDTAVVGAHKKTVGGHVGQGQAYVYVRGGATWSEQARLTALDGAANDQFGIAVSVSGDIAIIGASAATVGDNPAQGAAYVYGRSGVAWLEQTKLTASDGANKNYFGGAGAVSVSGNTAVIGASYKTLGFNPLAGGAYVYGLTPQPINSDCSTNSDCQSGSCVANLCAAANVDVDMGTGTTATSQQLALIGSGFGSGSSCSFSASRTAPPRLVGVLGGLLVLGLLRRRKREHG